MPTNPTPNTQARPRIGAERGITLIVVMLILVVVTILGIGGAQIALLGERSTRYDRDYLIASQGAEAALKDAEFDIGGPNGGGTRAASFDGKLGFVNVVGLPVGGCGSSQPNLGLCEPPAATGAGGSIKPVWATVDFVNGTNVVPYGTFTQRSFAFGTAGIQPAKEPRYIIERAIDKPIGGSATNPGVIFRITAVGFGPRQEVQVVMQTVYRKP